MRLRSILWVLLILFIGMPVLAQEDSPAIEWTPCWMELPDGFVEGEDIECGYLLVPENRAKPGNTPTIELAFAIVYAPTEDVQPDPIIYLAGGPGGNAVADVESWLEIPYLGDRDLILLDQRGTGYSLPSLNCPEVEAGEEEVEAGEDNGTEACRDRLIDEGVDLQAYNSAENAADVADLRVALEYDEWNLYGISYGTRLALTVMRDHPEGVRSVIIDSVYPPEVSSCGKNTGEIPRMCSIGCLKPVPPIAHATPPSPTWSGSFMKPLPNWMRSQYWMRSQLCMMGWMPIQARLLTPP